MLSILLLSTGMAQAGFENIPLDVTIESTQSVGFSDDFLEKLHTCQPSEEKIQNFDTSFIYTINGLDSNRNCTVEYQAVHPSMSVKTVCRFDADTLATFYEAQTNFRQKRNNFPSFNALLKDEDGETINEIWNNPAYCTFSRTGFDPTAEIRKNLIDCTASKSEIKASRSELSSQIDGYKDGKCHYLFDLTDVAASAEDARNIWGDDDMQKMASSLKDIHFSADCLFSSEEQQQYIDFLASTAMQADNQATADITQTLRQLNQNIMGYLFRHIHCRCDVDTVKDF
jgi:hypothetical protein